MYRPFRRIGDKLRPAQTIIRYHFLARLRKVIINGSDFLRDYINVHQSLVALTLFILASNLIVIRTSNQAYTTYSEPLDPYKVADTVRVISPFLTDLDQDPDAIAVVLEEKINGTFISTNPLLATQPGQTEEPDILTPSTPSPQVAKRTAESKYVVQIGDTLSVISQRYNVSTDTVRVKNNLTDADSIKPGQTLIIPAQNLSAKAIAAADTRGAGPSKVPTKIVSGPKAGSYGFVVPIHYTAIARRLVHGHTGIDYDAPVGTPIIAGATGTIVQAEGGWNGGFGTTILENVGGGMTLRYGHMSKLGVSPGQTVSQGQIIGYSGNTGRSTGPHLHFELRVNGVARDPGT